MSAKKGPVRSWAFVMFYAVMLLGGIFMHAFFFDVQENFYTGTNHLCQLYVAAGIWQLSLTSATAVFYTTSVGLLIVLIIAEFKYTREVRFFLLGLIAAGIVVAALASLILALPLIVIRPTDP